MAFRAPTLNTDANIWHHSAVLPPAALGPPDLANEPCQLRIMKTAFVQEAWLGSNFAPVMAAFAAGSDIRGDYGWGNGSPGTFSLAELPAGSGRFYRILAVDDSGKGFSNEYRIAALIQLAGVPPAFPIP